MPFQYFGGTFLLRVTQMSGFIIIMIKINAIDFNRIVTLKMNS